MTTEAEMKPEGESKPEERPGRMSRWMSAVKRRPIVSLGLAAGVSAIAGAELLAAGLAGGALVLLAEHSDTLRRARQRLMEEARSAIERGRDVTRPSRTDVHAPQH